jgi:hypothetical protein
MLALYRSGRQAEALQAFAHTRDVLVDDLRINPSAELRELERRILVQDRELLLTVGRRRNSGRCWSPTSTTANGTIRPSARVAFVRLKSQLSVGEQG